MYKLLTRVLGVALLSISLLLSQAFQAPPVYALGANDINAQSAILIDSDTGAVIFEKNADARSFPASITKVLTALIILENHKLDEKVVIDKDSPNTTGSRIFVMPGEEFTVEQLLHAMLLPSANDAALAMARFHSGSVEKFAEVMNKRAAALGAKNSHFVNPNGLTDPNHYTSARDFALIAMEAMKNPDFRRIVKTVSYQIPPTNKQPEVRVLQNSNRFLYGVGSGDRIPYKGKMVDIKYDFVTGVKTGYTTAAGQCFVTSMTKNGRNLISVIMKAQGAYLYIDSRTLLDYGADDTLLKTFFKKGDLVDYIMASGGRKISMYAGQDVSVYMDKTADPSKIRQTITKNSQITFPVDPSKPLGKVVILYNDRVLASTPLFAAGKISAEGTLSDATQSLTKVSLFDQKELPYTAAKVVGALILWRILMTFMKTLFRGAKRTVKRYTA